MGLCAHARSNPGADAPAPRTPVAREPWLLTSSLGLQHLSVGDSQALRAAHADRANVSRYQESTCRAEIEVTRSRGQQRPEMLLLMAHLTSLVQRLMGESAKQQQLELQFMATRRARRRKISSMTLARLPFSMQRHAICDNFCLGRHTATRGTGCGCWCGGNVNAGKP